MIRLFFQNLLVRFLTIRNRNRMLVAQMRDVYRAEIRR